MKEEPMKRLAGMIIVLVAISAGTGVAVARGAPRTPQPATITVSARANCRGVDVVYNAIHDHTVVVKVGAITGKTYSLDNTTFVGSHVNSHYAVHPAAGRTVVAIVTVDGFEWARKQVKCAP